MTVWRPSTRSAEKLVFYASQTAYFQSQLAHAEYVAAPRPVWPDSPAAEAVSVQHDLLAGLSPSGTARVPTRLFQHRSGVHVPIG